MDFDNLPYYVLIEIMMYVSIQDRLENVRQVSKWWKSVAEDSLRKQRKLTFLAYECKCAYQCNECHITSWMKTKIKPTDLHSIIKLPVRRPRSVNMTSSDIDMVYMSHVFSLCRNLEELHIDDIFYYKMRISEAELFRRTFQSTVTELLNLMHSSGIKLKSFTYDKAYLNEWPFPLQILESLAVDAVSDELVVKILDQSTNLKHLELDNCRNWPTIPSGLLSLKSRCIGNVDLSNLMNSPAFHTIESLEGILVCESFNSQTKVFPKLHHASFHISLYKERCLESCNKLITFLEQIPLLESLGLSFYSSKGAVDILFSIPQFVDVLRRLKKLDIYFNSSYITVNMLNVLRSCRNTELSMVAFTWFDEDGHLLHDILSFLVDMSANIKHFAGYIYKQPIKVCDLDVLRQLHTSHEILMNGIDIQNIATEGEKKKFVGCIKITAREIDRT